MCCGCSMFTGTSVFKMLFVQGSKKNPNKNKQKYPQKKPKTNKNPQQTKPQKTQANNKLQHRVCCHHSVQGTVGI